MKRMNGKTERRIVWLVDAKNELKKLISFIRKDSSQNAASVKKDVLKKISELAAHPERHAPDKYKLLNTNNSYRAFEIHRIRISYFVQEDLIMIIRIRHTSQEPLFH